MSLLGKFKNNRFGFTMAEILIAIAIIAVLAGVATPSIIAIRSNLEMTELDAAARSIFVASQNRMSELRASGEFREVNDATGAAKAVALGGAGMAEPTDFPYADVGTWDAADYFVLQSNDPAVASLLPANALEASLLSGHFYIEYSAKTGMVYGVFYAKEYFSYAAGPPRGAAERSSYTPRLGYYGGSAVNFVELGVITPPDFKLHNEGELFGSLTGTEAGINYTITVSDGTNEWSHLLGAVDPNNIITGDAVLGYTILLDSLKSGKQFKSLFVNLTPGADLKVTVTAEADGKIPVSVSDTANSLFAYVDGEGTALLEHPRHLQNLHPGFSGVNSSITGASLSNEIDWATAGVSFKPIDNNVLLIFNGNGNPIRNLDKALFDNFSGSASAYAEVNMVKLINSKVTSSSNNSGTLANYARYTKFTDCQVYANTPSADACTLISTGDNSTGGLIGRAEYCSITGSFAALTRISGRNGYIGGLVGRADNTVISMSYANTGYWNALMGIWKAGSGIVQDSGISGGFVGNVSGGSITNCYALGYIKVIYGKTAGFAGISSISISNSYSATIIDSSANVAVGGFVENGSYDSTTCYFYKGGVSGDAASAPGSLSYDNMKVIFSANENWVTATSATTNAYGRAVDDALPFPRLRGLFHYGDWPDDDTKFKSGLYYYEKYEGNIYGFYAYSVDTLRDDLPVLSDGYAFLTAGSAPPEFQESNIIVTELLSPVPAAPEFTAYRLSGIPVPSLPFYTKITLTDGISFWLNPGFAKTAVNGASSTPAIPKSILIRTARHIAVLGGRGDSSSYYADSRSYLQERDIDFSLYTPAQTAKPIGLLRGAFNGGGNRIVITSFSGNAGAEYTALFTELPASGSVVGVNLIGAPGAVISGTGFYTAGLVGCVRSGGVVEKCSVTDLAISGTGYVGGLLGTMDSKSTVSGCSVQNVTITGSGSNIGGFAGQITGNLDIDSGMMDCTAKNVTVTGNASYVGGFVGVAPGGAITRCSLTGTINVSGPDGIGGFVGSTGVAAIITDSYVRGTGVATVTGSVQKTGGFAGNNQGTITNCAVSGVTVDGAFHVGGFVGYNDEGAITNCSAANGYFGSDTSGGSVTGTGATSTGGFVGTNYIGSKITACYTVALFGNQNIGGFVGTNSGNGTEIIESYCATKDSDGAWADFYIQNTSGAVITADSLAYNGTNANILNNTYLSGSWGLADASHSFPYDPELAGLEYPFPAIVKDSAGQYVHYGNWPEATAAFDTVDGLYYYEKYDDGTFGFYAEIGGQIYDNLDNVKVVRDGGYMYVSNGGTPTIKYRDNVYGTTDNSFATAGAGDIVTMDLGSGKTAYMITTTMEAKIKLYADPVRTGFNELRIDGKTYYYNPDFAKTVYAPNAQGVTPIPPAHTVATSFELRTARHVAGLGKNHNDHNFHANYSTSSFKQTRDVDFTTYNNPPVFNYICSNSDPFKGSYDGGGYSITMSGALTSYGLFGQMSGTIENVNLIGAPGTTFNASVGERGGLVGSLRGGTVRNCSISNITITGTGTYIGAVAGYVSNNSIIENCSATNVSINIASDNIGGFAGYVNSGTITGSTVTGTGATTVSARGYTGGFVGYITGGSISDCHVDGMSVTGTGSHVGGFAGNSSIEITGCSVTGTGTTTVTGGGDNVGGFAGTQSAPISNCTVTDMAVSGKGYLGGFAGALSGSSTSNCHATLASVTGTGTHVGGFAGTSSSTITGSTVTGMGTATVTGGESVGGFIGNNGALISNSIVTGMSVSGQHRIGGFVGANGSTISDCIARASESGEDSVTVNGTGNYAGGFVGNNGGTINRGAVLRIVVTGNYMPGPFYGNKGNISNCTVDGIEVQ